MTDFISDQKAEWKKIWGGGYKEDNEGNKLETIDGETKLTSTTPAHI